MIFVSGMIRIITVLVDFVEDLFVLFAQFFFLLSMVRLFLKSVHSSALIDQLKLVWSQHTGGMV